MYLSQTVTGDMRTIAQYLLIYRLTDSVAILGVMALVSALPGILMPLVGGVIADRLPKKYIIVLGQASAMIPSLLVAVSLTTGFLSAEHAGSWWIIIVASFLNYVVFGLSMPSRQAVVADLVGADHIMNAISLRSMGYNILHMGVPAIAGVLIDVVGFEVVYYIMGGFSFIGFVLALFLPISGTLEVRSGNVLSQLKDGFKYIRGEFNLLFILGLSMMASLLATPYIRLMPVFVDDILKVGASGMGILLSASAVGSLASSIIMASLPNKRRGAMLLAATSILGIALTFFALSRNWYLSLAFIVIVGLTQPARATLTNTLLQSFTAPNYRGRVLSLYAMQDGITSLGAFVAAMVAEVVGVPFTVGGFALTIVLLSVLAMIFIPRIRKLE
jgi:MFS family permease